jgi:uncharacterized protein YsxB (DUF464 family)
MIQIDFPEAKDGRVTLRVSGHSGQNQRGNDIVCAAVSALVQTFAGGVESSLQARIFGKIDSGNCDLEVQVTEAQGQELQLLSNVFRFGFLKISQSYPEHVKLN